MNHRFRTTVVGRIVYWLFVCTCFAIMVELLRRNLGNYFPRDWEHPHEFDGLTDWRAARLSFLGVNPWSTTGLSMLHNEQVGWPPTTSFWYLAMVDFPKALVAEVSSLSLLILLLPHYYLCAKELKWPAPMAVTVLVASLVMSTEWLVYHWEMIQCSEHIAFLYVLSWLFLRRGQDTRAGLCIGVAMTLKLYPGVMAIMLLVGRRWRGFASASATYIAVAATMTMKYGFVAWLQFLQQEKPITDNWLGCLQNASLSGLVTQTLTPFCGPDYCGTHVDVGKWRSTIVGVISIILLVAAVLLSRTTLKRALDVDRRAIDLPFALFSVLSIFLNPFAWEHYYTVLVHPLFIIVTLLLCTYRTVYRRWSDENCSTATLILISGFGVACMASWVVVYLALSRDIWSPWRYIDLFWQGNRLSEVHWHAHYLLALNFAPWLIAILNCFALLRVRRRLGIW